MPPALPECSSSPPQGICAGKSPSSRSRWGTSSPSRPRKEQMPGDLARKVGVSLSPGGPLARAMRGFEARPGQLRMALAWAEALETPRVLVAEAATGIGKTLAYLVPSILSGRKTIVSTGTRTLQQQLMENDIPLVRDILQYPFSCAVLKGRGNYLCLRRWKRFLSEPLFEFARESGYFPSMRTFAENTRTGDVSEGIGVSEDARGWGGVNARSEMCDSSACGEIERCFLAAARRRAADADLLVGNPHPFFADLAPRARLGPAPRGAGRVRGGPGGARGGGSETLSRGPPPWCPTSRPASRRPPPSSSG